MAWSPPSYVEVKMDAEFSSYVDDLAADLDEQAADAPAADEDQ